MDKEIKKKWIKALRSGDYEQGRDCLRTADDGYCCLGVLCDQLGGRWEFNDVRTRYVFISDYGDDPEAMYLPHNLQQEVVGISVDDEMELAGMNDEDIPFNDIADWIEENL